jgi:hypothetical protein
MFEFFNKTRAVPPMKKTAKARACAMDSYSISRQNMCEDDTQNARIPEGRVIYARTQHLVHTVQAHILAC